MSGAASIKRALQSNHTFVLDGGLGTALEEKGYKLVTPLWSAWLLPSDTKAIQDLHVDFFRAGADFAITASYQASTRGLVEHLGVTYEEAKSLIEKSVKVARDARDATMKDPGHDGRPLYVAGSVGPYGAYLADGAEFTGVYGDVTEKELHDFHRDRIRILLDSGVDMLACETVPNIREVKALCDQLRDEFPTCIAWLSCTLKDSTHISDGTNFEEVIKITDQCDQIVAVGFNCMPITYSSEALSRLQQLTTKPLVIYPNSGEIWDARKKSWSGVNSTAEYLHDFAQTSHKFGARLIGGCCRTGCKEISAMKDAIRELSPTGNMATKDVISD